MTGGQVTSAALRARAAALEAEAADPRTPVTVDEHGAAKDPWALRWLAGEFRALADEADGLTWHPEVVIQAGLAVHPVVTAAGPPVPRYEAGSGIRPPTKGGKVRGVAREVVDGGGVELWFCEHDHAPGVRDCRKMLPQQREAAEACAEDWLRQQILADVLTELPVTRDEW